MKKEFEIHSSKFPYDMSAWCCQKAETVIIGLSQLIDFVKKQEMSSEVKGDFTGYLRSVLWDATKLLAFSCGAKWTVKDSGLIVEKGYTGYEKLAVRYKLLSETRETKRKKQISLFLEKFKEYLKSGRSPGRTLIYELLNTSKIEHPVIKNLKGLTEKVTMGEISWEEYVTEAKTDLSLLTKNNRKVQTSYEM